MTAPNPSSGPHATVVWPDCVGRLPLCTTGDHPPECPGSTVRAVSTGLRVARAQAHRAEACLDLAREHEDGETLRSGHIGRKGSEPGMDEKSSSVSLAGGRYLVVPYALSVLEIA
eukprot:3769448-Rhodomonas_salina.4